jgi:hypothetical protein
MFEFPLLAGDAGAAAACSSSLRGDASFSAFTLVFGRLTSSFEDLLGLILRFFLSPPSMVCCFVDNVRLKCTGPEAGFFQKHQFEITIMILLLMKAGERSEPANRIIYTANQSACFLNYAAYVHAPRAVESSYPPRTPEK